MNNYDAIIIGAGLTGLTTAFYLKKAGKKILILEKEEQAGGVIRTFSKKGFIYETGPNTGVLGTPEAAELFEDLGKFCKIEIANPAAKKRLIWKNNTWHALPSNPISAITTPLFKLSDKFRILGEPLRKKGLNPHESLSGLVKRRLGESFLDYAIDPFISGVYAGNTDELVPRYALPKLYNLEQQYGSFIKGAIKKKKTPKTERELKATREVFSAKNGLSNLIDALVKNIGIDNIVFNSDIKSIEKDKTGFKVSMCQPNNNHYFTSRVITTFGGDSLQKMFNFIKNDDLAKITNLKYAKVTQTIIGYKNWNGKPINAFGGLVPSKEKKDILGILFTSSFFKNRAPETGALLSIFAGGVKKPHINDLNNNDLLDIIENHLHEMLGVSINEADLVEIFRYEKAIPQYTINSKERLEAIVKIEKENPGLILAGNIRDGIGMADRIKQGKTIAGSIID